MNKLPMYTIMTVTMGIGGYLPVLFGQSMLGGWSVLGTVIGGIVGVAIYARARRAGYVS